MAKNTLRTKKGDIMRKMIAVMWSILMVTILVSSSCQTDVGVGVSESDFVSVTSMSSTSATTTMTTNITTTTTTATTTTTTQAKATKKTKNKATTAKVKGAKTTKATTTATTAKVTKATTTTSTTATTTTKAKTMVVVVDPSSHVNLRVNPGGRKKAELKDGDVVIVFDLTSYKGRLWANVTVEKTGQEGWLWASFLKEPEAKATKKTATTVPTTTAKATKATKVTSTTATTTTTSKKIPKYWNDRVFLVNNDGEEVVETEIIFNTDFGGKYLSFDWEGYRIFGFENIEAEKVGEASDFVIYYFEIKDFNIKGEITYISPRTLWLEVRVSSWEYIHPGTYQFYPAEKSLLR